MITLKLKYNEPIDRALKRLKRIMDKERVILDLRERQYYMKPSEKKRMKSARARARAKRDSLENQ